MSAEPSFGQVVKSRRRDLGLTQEELAGRVGCAPVTLRKIEHDDLRPSVQVAERLAMALNVTREERAAFVSQARRMRVSQPVSPTPEPRREEIGLVDLSGRAVRGYALGERIGQGGMGAVYRAVQPVVGREVAIKIILPQYADHPDFIRRFEAEAQLIARLEHPHIVPLYDFWREPGVAYLVMRLLRGGSLKTLLEAGPLTLALVSRLVEQVAGALAAAHRAGVVHRDLKPGNILLDEDGNAYLADFGIAMDAKRAERRASTDVEARALRRPCVAGDTQGAWRDPHKTDVATEAALNELGAIVGSPPYFSPEQIRDEFIQPQTDIYCLGVVLYELLTGALPFTGPTPVDILHQHLSAPLPPLAAHRAGLPGALDAVIGRATAKEPAQRYPTVDDLLADWRRAMAGTGLAADFTTAAPAPSPARALTEADNPYKGLRAFTEADADDFFGREALIQRLLIRLGEGGDLARFLAVVGPSGSGKSSVAKAGLIPALRRGGLPGSEHWFIVEFTPGPHPYEALEAALLRVAVNPPASLLEQLQDGPRGLLCAVERCLPAEEDAQLVLVADQFEEVFTLVGDEAERARLLASLVAAVLDEQSRVRVVVTLRADFTDRPLRYVDFGEFLRQRSEFVLPLTPDELERAIEGPAERAGLILEPGLTAALIHDVGDQPGALPLLQYTLTELFERREGATLTRQAYGDLGGITGALAHRAEAAFVALDPESQSATRQLFLRLVTLGEGASDGLPSPDTRRRVLRTELEALGPASSLAASSREASPAPNPYPLAPVLHDFGKARLLSFDRDPATRAPTVEVAHEALLREWPRLRGWLDESRGDIRMQRGLAQAAAEWQAANRDPSYLLTGARLAQFEGWISAATPLSAVSPRFDGAQAAQAAVALTPGERAYYDASVAEREKREKEEAARQGRELETAKKLAETEKRRADEQVQSLARVRLRNRLIAVAGVTALVLAVVAGVFGLQSNQNLGAAQIANTQSAASAATAQAEAQVRATAEAQAVANLQLADAQRLAAEANRLFIENRDYETAALLALRSLALKYTPQGDEALSRATRVDYPDRELAGHANLVRPMAFSADGKLMVSSDDSGTVIVWDVATGQIQQQFKAENGVTMVTLSPDGRTVATGGDDGLMRVWDAATGRELYRRDYGAGVWGLAITPNGKDLLIGGWDHTARLLDLATGDEIRQFAHSGAVLAVAVSSDGKLALTGSDDGVVRLLELETGRDRLKFNTPVPGWPWAVAFAPDMSTFAIGQWEKIAYIYDTQTGKELVRLPHTDELYTAIPYSPDGRYVLTSDTRGAAHLWDVKTGAEVRRFLQSTAASGIAFTPDGQHAVTGSLDKLIRFWPLNRTPLQNEIKGAGFTEGKLAFTRDGNMILSQGLVFDVQSGERQFKDGSSAVGFADISADGRSAYVVWGSNAAVLDASTWTPRLVVTSTCASNPYAAGISPDGALMGLGSFTAPFKICLFDSHTGKVARLIDILSLIVSLEFSPDGRLIATSGCDASVHLYDTATGAELRAMTMPGLANCIIGLAFTPDGRYVLSAGTDDGTLWLWDVQTGENVSRFTGHTGNIRGVAISSDGRYAVSGGDDGTARLWDMGTGKELRRFAGHASTVWGVAFSPDGSLVATSSSDGTLKFWNTDLEKTRAAMCGLLIRDLTGAERARYNITDPAPTCPAT